MHYKEQLCCLYDSWLNHQPISCWPILLFNLTSFTLNIFTAHTEHGIPHICTKMFWSFTCPFCAHLCARVLLECFSTFQDETRTERWASACWGSATTCTICVLLFLHYCVHVLELLIIISFFPILPPPPQKKKTSRTFVFWWPWFAYCFFLQ